MRALFGLVRGELAARSKEAAAQRTRVARLTRQVVHLHVLDEVALAAHRLGAEAALVAGSASQLGAVRLDKLIRRLKV